MKILIDYIFHGFSTATTFIAIGLLLNTVASIIVLIPYLITKIDIDDDLIEHEYVNKKTGKYTYTQKKHIKSRKVGIWGFTLFVIGFLLQFLGIFIQVHLGC